MVGFNAKFSNLIVEDHLEEAVKFLLEHVQTVPQCQDARRWEYVREQTENLAGQLSKLNENVRLGIFNVEEQTKMRNQIRKNLQDFPKLLSDPHHKDLEYEKADLIRTGKKWGMMALRVYLIWTAIVLLLAVVVGAFIYSQVHGELFPKPFSQRLINSIPQGRKLQVLDYGTYNHGGLSTMKFYKVQVDGYTRWVRHDDCDYVNPKCVGN